MTSTPTTVFISGANGFLAQHIVKQLLGKGYNVVGSVRSGEKGEQLKKLLKGYENKFTYEVIPDLVREDAFYEALQNHPEVTVFLHTASTVSLGSKNIEAELLIPAVSGTKNVLNAIKKYAPQITNFVYTSSALSLADLGELNDPNLAIDEGSWNPVTWDQAKNEAVQGYSGSKTFAERAVWDFVEAEKPNFVVNTVLPSFCFGPQAFEVKETLNLSANITAGLLQLTPESDIPDFIGGFIDVRDAAKAHIAAFENENIKGQRLILNNSYFTNQMIVDIIRNNFAEFKSTLPVGNPDKSVEFPVLNDAKSRKLLGWEFFNLEATTVDAIKQILEAKA